MLDVNALIGVNTAKMDPLHRGRNAAIIDENGALSKSRM